MKWIDLPPVWLSLAIIMAWCIADLQPTSLVLGGSALDLLGGLCVGAGLVLMLLAVVEMRKCRTTIIPHMEAAHLVTTGIFARSRNPIYLGDAFVLAGLALCWTAPVAILLVPVFAGIITRRFILPEEERLRRKFGTDFVCYCEKARRWL